MRCWESARAPTRPSLSPPPLPTASPPPPPPRPTLLVWLQGVLLGRGRGRVVGVWRALRYVGLCVWVPEGQGFSPPSHPRSPRPRALVPTPHQPRSRLTSPPPPTDPKDEENSPPADAKPKPYKRPKGQQTLAQAFSKPRRASQGSSQSSQGDGPASQSSVSASPSSGTLSSSQSSASSALDTPQKGGPGGGEPAGRGGRLSGHMLE